MFVGTRHLDRMLGILNTQLPRDRATVRPRLAARPQPGHGYVLYAHVPFCERLCTYCSFNRFLFNEERARAYFEHLRDEMRMVADLGYDFDSMYVGGGTPTILLDELCETIDLARELFSITEVSSETSPNHLGPELVETLDGRVAAALGGRAELRRRAAPADGPLRQVRHRRGDPRAPRGDRGHVPLAQRRHDLQLPEPDRGHAAAATSSCVKETGANQTTFYPLMASPAASPRARRRRSARSTTSARRATTALVDRGAGAGRSSPRARGRSRATADGMIDEYIVDYAEYVGIGSGALSFLDGTIYGNTFSLAEYGDAHRAPGRMARRQARAAATAAGASMRYRFVTDLFGLRLDKRRFRRDFGVPVELGLPAEIAFMRWSGALATNTPRRSRSPTRAATCCW